MKMSTVRASLGAAFLLFGVTACNFPGFRQEIPQPTQVIPVDLPTELPELVVTETPFPTLQETAAVTIPPSPTVMIPTVTASQVPVPATSTTAPTLPPSTTSKTYAVVLVDVEDVLNVRSGAGISNPIVGSLSPTSSGITLTGRNQQAGDGGLWVEINRAGGGTGWVNATFLTESVSKETFCSDPQVTDLLKDFAGAISAEEGETLSSLISPEHGLYVQYFHTGTAPNYSPEEARFVFSSSYVTNWGIHPASGLEVRGTFHEEVLPKIQEVVESDNEIGCGEMLVPGVSYEAAWPTQYRNFNFYSIHKPGTPGMELDWRTWVVGIEYVNGDPYLVSLLQYFWEP
ncbi:MAG: hypothetical protein EHM41_14740 [Chloroflexi bacterium]|nr:MAG: hypothetical protein EHM41_14740 [Chloroflexota bacterium]